MVLAFLIEIKYCKKSKINIIEYRNLKWKENYFRGFRPMGANFWHINTANIAGTSWLYSLTHSSPRLPDIEWNQKDEPKTNTMSFFTMGKLKNRLIQLFLCNDYSSQKIYTLLSLMCTWMVFDLIVTFYFPHKYKMWLKE